jgi:hypothetical protein
MLGSVLVNIFQHYSGLDLYFNRTSQGGWVGGSVELSRELLRKMVLSVATFA